MRGWLPTIWSSPESSNDALDILVDELGIKTDDQLRNINSHEYLLYITKQMAHHDDFDTCASLQLLKIFLNEHAVYHPGFAYGDLYEKFFSCLENEITNKAISWKLGMKGFLLNAIFLNDNAALERASGIFHGKLDSRKIGSYFAMRTEKAVNKTTPQTIDAVRAKASSMGLAMTANYFGAKSYITSALWFTGIFSDFKPMFQTSQLSIRRYAYQLELLHGKGRLPVEIRSGTQAQYHDGVACVNPLFKEWIQSCGKTLVYFNHLKIDGDTAERIFERNMSLVLHDAENAHDNLLVITLPSDGGLMDHENYLKKDCSQETKKYYEKVQDIFLGKKVLPTQDFKISDKVEKMLYGAALENKNTEIERLLTLSFKKITGIDNPKDSIELLCDAQLQAVYFHFVNYEFPNFILEKLDLDYVIHACKDGIDRASKASAYRNFMKAIECGYAFSEEELHRALHAASIYVKGRGMNFHLDMIWNALSYYAEMANRSARPLPRWLPAWIADNMPDSLKKISASSVPDALSPPSVSPAPLKLQ